MAADLPLSSAVLSSTSQPRQSPSSLTALGLQPECHRRCQVVAHRLPKPTGLTRRSSRGVPGRGALTVVASTISHPSTFQGDGNVKELKSRADWEAFMKEAGDGRLVVVDSATKTCGPCRFIYPKVVELSLEYPDVLFLKIFGDLNAETRSLMREWGIRSVPNFRFYRNGELIHSHIGAKEEDLRKFVKQFHSQAVPVS